MDLQLNQRVALVTGGSQGLGFAAALQLSREGALVALCSRDQAHVDAATHAIQTETRRPVLGIAADIIKSKDVKRVVQRTVDEFGGLDVLVANPGGGPTTGTFDELADDQWAKATDLLVMSMVRLIREALPHLRQSTAPSVLTVTSLSSKQPIPNLILSNSLRMAVLGMTKTLSQELGKEGIRFNSILPGWTTTDRVHELMEDRARRNGTTVEEELSKQSAESPLGRMGTPQEFANVAAFLCSPAASYVTGTMIPVDGGSYRGII
jgi:3-oxoacyl-[acyl-carrier protein] reductase